MFGRRIALFGLFFALTLSLPVVASASESLSSKINLATLTRLYQSQLGLKGKSDAMLDRRIEIERARVRSAVEDQINDLVNAMNRSSTGGVVHLAESLAQQRAIVSALQTRSDAAQVDHDLLDKEEKEFYLNPSTETGAAADYRITTSYPDLLARRAALDEELAAFTSYLHIENDRVTRLAWQQRLEQFSLFIEFAKYLIVLLLVVLIERLIRLNFIIKIQNANARYAAMKLFTALVYVLSIFWVLSSLSAQYPGILTSLAIFGAVVAFSIQDVLKDIVGWLVILQRRLFVPGDRITIGAYTGDVVDLGILRMTMVEVGNSTMPEVARAGQIIALPNSMVLNNPVMNYNANSDYVEGEIVLTITYDSNWKRAKEILEDILGKETETLQKRARLQNAGRMKHLYVSKEQSGSRVVMEPKPRGITFTLRFLVPIGQRSVFTSKVSELVFTQLASETSIRVALDANGSINLFR